MSNDNVWERLFKLWSAICKMIVDGVRDPGKVADVLQTIVDGAGVRVYLRRLYEAETIVIGATDGTETFASSGLFSGGVYGETLPVGESIPTPEIGATVHEQIVDGNFSQVFGETSGEFTQAQVCEFIRNHQGKLRKDGYATFFRVRGAFVARVFFDGGGRLHVYVGRFSGGGVWGAGRRLRASATVT